MQEATEEVTLKTEVDLGASGYSITGGEDRGIFVKQVLKDSSAAKLFSLREGTKAVPSLRLHYQHQDWRGWAHRSLRMALWSWLRHLRLGLIFSLWSEVLWGLGTTCRPSSCQYAASRPLLFWWSRGR